MRKLFHFLCVSILSYAVFSTTSCSGRQITEQEENAPRLYARSTACIRKYIDSIKTAPDSSAVTRLMNEFQESLTKINFEFPPNTDLSLGEDENDTLFYLTSRLIETRDQRLKSFAVSDSDSISPSFHPQPNRLP